MVRAVFSVSTCRAVLAMAAAVVALSAQPSHAVLVFSDAFAYATGTLSGDNGGTGWNGGWSGGASTVTTALPGTYGTSVRISDDASVTNRLMTAPITTGSATTYYLSFVFNANPFPPSLGGDYAGVSLVGTGTSSASLFVGTPGSSGRLGFDWASEGDGLYAAANNTNYLTVLAIAPSANPGRSIVTLYASTNLLISGTALIGGTPLALPLEGDSFSFGGVEIAGGYNSGSINLAGLALATTVDEAVGFTQIAVPEPGMTLAVAACTVGLAAMMRRRLRNTASHR